MPQLTCPLLDPPLDARIGWNGWAPLIQNHASVQPPDAPRLAGCDECGFEVGFEVGALDNGQEPSVVGDDQRGVDVVVQEEFAHLGDGGGRP